MTLTDRLSPNLTVAEFTSTREPRFVIANREAFAADAQLRQNALRHARDLWQPTRDLVGPLRCSSGFRFQQLNEAVGGDKYSRHKEALATDDEPLEMPMLEAFMLIKDSKLPYDQLIWEYSGWIHLGSPRHGVPPRRDVFMKFLGTDYLPFDVNDPRVRG